MKKNKKTLILGCLIWVMFLPCVAFSENSTESSFLSDALQKSFDEVMKRNEEKEETDVVKKLRSVLSLTTPYDQDRGSEEDRIKPWYEDNLVLLLERLPPYVYQYIGPYLHSVAGMSERVLNMPGIKETKGKLPTRIAPEMQEFAEHYLEYLSPHFYFLLMPEAWGHPPPEVAHLLEGEPVMRTARKIPLIRSDAPRTVLPAVKNVLDNADPTPYMRREPKKKNMTRTMMPTKDSPLTEGDVAAFISTVDELRAWGDKDKRKRLREIRHFGYKDSHMSILTGNFDTTNMMLDIAYPCTRIAQRVKALGHTKEFEAIVGKEGFSLDAWASTCDKTIKGYRVANMNWEVAYTLYDWKKRKKELVYREGLTPKEQDQIKKNIDLFLEMFSAPESDRLAVSSYLTEIRQNFMGQKELFLSLPFFGIR